MTFEIGDTVRFEPDRGQVITGTVTSVKGRETWRIVGVCCPGVSENYLIPERHLSTPEQRK
jgi:hypothetical protein